jgi:hypothetical protein
MTHPISEIVVNMAELSTSSVHAAELQTQTTLAGKIHSTETKSRVHSKETKSRVHSNKTQSQFHSKATKSGFHSNANRSRCGLPGEASKLLDGPFQARLNFSENLG